MKKTLEEQFKTRDNFPQEVFDELYTRVDDPWGLREKMYPYLKTVFEWARPSIHLPIFRYIDIGCGYGQAFQPMADVFGYPRKVVGVDISSVVLERARNRFTQWPGISMMEFFEMKIQDPPGQTTWRLGPLSYDLVTSFNTLYYVPRKEREQAYENVCELSRKYILLADGYKTKRFRGFPERYGFKQIGGTFCQSNEKGNIKYKGTDEYAPIEVFNANLYERK